MTNIIKRQPIVVVLGHVDHGKTSLLDALRQTSVVTGEAGGITQSIGASVVTYSSSGQSKSICFIDTPGHAIFSGMRSRGSKIADIALLIVDGSDGVKPQTKEAINLIKESEIPFIVVITKIDLPAASVENTLAELEKEEIFFEGRGGQTSYIGVSAKKKEKLDELLELITLVADVNNIQGDPDGELESYVIETEKDRAGNQVSIVVRNGTITVGDKLFSSGVQGKVKGLFDFKNNPIKSVTIGEPARILGFEGLPEVGSKITREPIVDINNKSVSTGRLQVDSSKIPLYIKTNSTGSLEALLSSIPQEFVVIEKGVGDVTESDVLNAKANGALIFVFESKIPSGVAKLAEMDKVKIFRFDIIYELLQKLDEIIKSGLVKTLGKAEILASFPFDNRRVAGCKMLLGKINKSSDIRLVRDNSELGKVKVLSIKKQKQEVNEVSQGEEFGIFFAPQLDFRQGDVIVAVEE